MNIVIIVFSIIFVLFKFVVVYLMKMFVVFKEIVDFVLLMIGGNDNIVFLEFFITGNTALFSMMCKKCFNF